MSTLSLGAAPKGLTVTLTVGADFIQQLSRKDATPWPTGATLGLEFTIPEESPTVWPATLVGPTASWNVDAAEVDALLAKRVKAVRLWYEEGEARLLWAMGDIDKRGV